MNLSFSSTNSRFFINAVIALQLQVVFECARYYLSVVLEKESLLRGNVQRLIRI